MEDYNDFVNSSVIEISRIVVEAGAGGELLNFLDSAIETGTMYAYMSDNNRITDRYLGSVQFCYGLKNALKAALKDDERNKQRKFPKESGIDTWR